MGTTGVTIPNAVVSETESDVQPSATQTGDDSMETKLAEEIGTLWGTHVRLSADRKATARELRQLRASLAERLYAMKGLLARPGRGGQWRSWLKERGIPRSSADRLVSRYLETLGADSENMLSGAISEPTKDSAGAKLAKGVWPQITKYLATDEAVIAFIGGIAEASGINHQWRAKGLMIFYPVPKVADVLPGPASAPEPTTAASGDATGNTGEQAA